MDELDKIAKQMKNDWDRRVSHDYRFWMSDGHVNDTAMWESGKRDLDILFSDIQSTESSVLLEIGCGVGRLLKNALGRFKKVIGIDVSEQAIAKARDLIGNAHNLELHVGSGTDLNPIASGSVDLVLSYAALTSIPTEIIARYLVEAHRVLKPGGMARLQMYLGEEQIVGKTDTLHLRCYREQNFMRAAQAAGFSVSAITELKLPFQVSFKDVGIVAVIVSLKRENVEPQSAEEVSQCLLPQGEMQDWDESKSLEVEAWMALNYAQDLADQGDFARAREALEYVSTRNATTAIDIQDLLQNIIKKVEEGESKKSRSSQTHTGFREKNVAVMSERFPEIAQEVVAYVDSQTDASEIAVVETSEGPTLQINGQSMDHPTKPRTAGETWVRRTLQERRIADSPHLIVFGLGMGWHVAELISQASDKKISVIEPSMRAFVQALESRDLTSVLGRIEKLAVGSRIPNWFDHQSELVVRPQSQAVFADVCAAMKSECYGKRGIVTLHPKIGVLGPLQGGTLPITGYCTRGLQSIHQRGRELDMSGFNGGFQALERFTVEKLRLGVMQGTYLEMLSQVVLESVNEKPVDILFCMAQAPITGRVLQELRRRGIITVLWFVEDYTRFTYWQSMAQHFDFIFTIQKGECLEQLKKAGAGEVHYLPVACDPIIHAPVSLTPEERQRWGSPISFVGAGYHNRQQVFASFAEMPFKIWGTEWPECRPFDRMLQEQGRRLSPDEYNKIFNATDVNINLHSSTERDSVDPYGDFVNPRTFELASAGAFQLCDERSLLPELFEPGKEIITFSSTADLKEKIAYYLNRPEERQQVAQRARQRVLNEHTYAHRMQQMLSKIYSSRFEKIKAREDASPWRRMIERANKDPELESRLKTAYERGEEPNLDGLVADIVTGNGKLSETEQKLLFLYHVRKQIIRMRAEEGN